MVKKKFNKISQERFFVCEVCGRWHDTFGMAKFCEVYHDLDSANSDRRQTKLI